MLNSTYRRQKLTLLAIIVQGKTNYRHLLIAVGIAIKAKLKLII